MECKQQALFRYRWAGHEKFCCLEHAEIIQGVAHVIGYYVQFILLSKAEQAKASCSQKLKEDE
jgi:hypothetical protein